MQLVQRCDMTGSENETPRRSEVGEGRPGLAKAATGLPAKAATGLPAKPVSVLPAKPGAHLPDRQAAMPRSSRAGDSLRTIATEAAAAGGRLRAALGAAETGFVGDWLRLLSEQTCRVAVIGQIKAGKSSFINALVGKRELLPTDVNPSTTAVTRLHFATAAGGPAASFQMFTAEEWGRLAESEGRLGELTERFVPGFERQLLKSHAAAVKAAAERRLGPRFHELLGQTHAFDQVSPALLSRYVCAGEPGRPASGVGELSDVTRTADIVLPGGPFAFPTTVIDTPGTNDPFLIRDEITRSCLDQADIYLIVLSARQPLGPADLSLLRILHGLNKEQIVVFINRIDELGAVGADTRAIVAEVRRRLDRELAGAAVPIVAGSAAWAMTAIEAAGDGINPVVDARCLAYLQERGLLRREDLVRPAGAPVGDTPQLSAALLAGSGIPEVHEAIGAMLGGCRATHIVAQIVGGLGEIARAAHDQARADAARMSRDFETASAASEQGARELERLRAEMARLEEAVRVVESSERQYREQLAGVVAEETTALHGELVATVDAHASAQAANLFEALSEDCDLPRWRCQTDDLRRDLAAIFVAGFRGAETRIAGLHETVLPHLERLLTLLTGRGSEAGGQVRPEPARMTPPSMRALGNQLVLDMRIPWWRTWWTARPSPEVRARELQELVRGDFYPLVGDLIGSFTAELDGRVQTMARWSFGVSSAILSSLTLQHERLLAHFESVRARLGDPAAAEATRAYIAGLEARASVAGEVAETMARLSAGVARVLNPAAEQAS
jgi:signal recognition particle receptor subunit beta